MKSAKRITFFVLLLLSLAVMLALELSREYISASAENGENIYYILTRCIGGVACVFLLILTNTKKILYARPTLVGTLCFLPCMLIAINNFPFITYFSGRAYIDAPVKNV